MPLRRILVIAALAALFGAAPAHPRIVVLVPSLAEDAVAVGAMSQVVGVSQFTSDVPGLAGVPAVGDFQSIDTERIVTLHPDVVIGIPSQARLIAPLSRAGIRTVLVADGSYGDIFTDLQTVGDLSGHAAQARSVIARLQAQTAALHATVAHRAFRPSVFVALGTGPIWTAGRTSYLARLIELAGGRNAADDLRAPWGEYSEEALLRAQPDAVFAGYDTDPNEVKTREPWRSLRAVREGHVFIITDQRLSDAIFRPGPRYIEGLRWLIARLSSLSTPKTQPAR